jgi:hypothetical protein
MEEQPEPTQEDLARIDSMNRAITRHAAENLGQRAAKLIASSTNDDPSGMLPEGDAMRDEAASLGLYIVVKTRARGNKWQHEWYLSRSPELAKTYLVRRPY